MKPLYKTKILDIYACDTSKPINIPYFQRGETEGIQTPAEDHMNSKIDLNNHKIQNQNLLIKQLQ